MIARAACHARESDCNMERNMQGNAMRSRELAWGLLIVLLIWAAGMAAVLGPMKTLERQNDAVAYDQFTWVGPLLAWQGPAFTSLEISGHAGQRQTITLSCGQAGSAERTITPGYFTISYSAQQSCAAGDFTIESDVSVVPGEQTGSNDMRKLSYQVGLITIDGRSVTLNDFIGMTQGAYGVEPHFGRVTARQVLTSTWDSMWYWRIAAQGYSFDGNTSVQQTVAWPFLYPYLGKVVSAGLDLSTANALLVVSALACLGALAALFLLGHSLGLSLGLALLAPLWLAFNPFSVFLYGGFSESLFVFLFATAAILTVYRKWWLAAVVIAALTATRFVGALAVFPLIAHWLVCHARRRTLVQCAAMIVAFGSIAALGVVADVLVKWQATGEPLAAFLIRSAWEVTTLSDFAKVLRLDLLFAGEYLPLLWWPVILIVMGLWAGIVLVRKQAYPAAIVVASGLSMVLATWILNPELQSLGRYSLPLAIAVAGMLGWPSLHNRAAPALTVLTVSGGGFIGLVASRFYFGLPPF
jgi:hypothetical protein